MFEGVAAAAHGAASAALTALSLYRLARWVAWNAVLFVAPALATIAVLARRATPEQEQARALAAPPSTPRPAAACLPGAPACRALRPNPRTPTTVLDHTHTPIIQWTAYWMLLPALLALLRGVAALPLAAGALWREAGIAAGLWLTAPQFQGAYFLFEAALLPALVAGRRWAARKQLPLPAALLGPLLATPEAALGAERRLKKTLARLESALRAEAVAPLERAAAGAGGPAAAERRCAQALERFEREVEQLLKGRGIPAAEAPAGGEAAAMRPPAAAGPAPMAAAAKPEKAE